MKKLRAAVYVYINSLISPKYYEDILKVDFKFSLKYYVFLALLASLVTFPQLVNPEAKEIKQTLLDMRQSILDSFPEELEITLKEGVLSMNQTEPFILPLKNFENSDNQLVGDIENLIVIDPKGTLDDLETYDTIILVNEKNILARDGQKTEIYPLKEIPDGVLNIETLTIILDKTNPVINAMPYLVLAIALLGTFMYYFIFRMIYLITVAVAIMIGGQIRGFNLNFKKYYQIAIHAITLPLTIEVLANLANYNIRYPYWFLILNILIGVFAIINLDKDDIDVANKL